VTTTRLAIFIATYLLIAVGPLPGLRLNRPAASLLGAVAMVAVGGLPLRDAYAAIDLDVLVFLLGILLLTGYLELGGFFEWAADHVIARVRSARGLLAAVVLVSGILSAFFINDTICLVLTPLLLAALRPLRLRELPFLLAVALSSNVGSAMAITGNPQNMLIGLASGIGFASFMATLALPALGGLVIVYSVLLFAFRRDLSVTLPRERVALDYPFDRPLVLRALVVFAATLAAWLAGFSLSGVSVAAGALMLALGRRDPADAFAKVEWELLLFFAALFVVIRGVRDVPLALDLTARAAGHLHGATWRDAWIVSGAMLALSNLVSNVPAVLLWLPAVPQLTHARFVWLVMAMSSTFAGNLTLVGSMANLIVAERAATRGVHLGFLDYLRVGVPVTLLSVAWGVAALMLFSR
jgi:Na+/H+ antiporter NhaD/arsenite permease-like protein